MEKKASAKRTTKKTVVKPTNKVTKKAVSKKTAAPKKTAKKVSKSRTKKTMTVKPVTDSTGVVTLRSVDDAGSISDTEGVRVEATVDKETGVVTMAPATK